MAIDPTKKLAGLLVPTFALRREFDFGIGDTYAMHEAIDFCHDHNIGVLQILPINETGGDHSPYGAISSVALEPAYITMSPNTVPGLLQQHIQQQFASVDIEKLRQGPVKYPDVKALKRKLLFEAFTAFELIERTVEVDEAREFEAFQQEHRDWLSSYTLFRTLTHEHDGNACWTWWPKEQQTLAGAQAWLDASPDAERLNKYRRFCAYVQWIAFRQWKEVKAYADSKSVRLMGDIPFGVSRYSADVWAERNLFDLEWSGGAPPEPLFQGDVFLQKWGQNWGIPLYNWDEHKKENYRWWRQRVQRTGEFFHDFRIDHVLGFFRIYAFPWIPERNEEFIDLTEEEAEELTGGKLPQFMKHPDKPEKFATANHDQGAALLKVILEAAGSMGVVAEDLGVVPKYVRPLLKKLGIPGFYIPQFERDEETKEYKPRDKMPPLSLGTYATHDHAPIRAFYEELVELWHGPDGHQWWLEVQRLMRYLELDEEQPPTAFTAELHMTFIQSLMESPCWLAVFMITDLLGTSQRFNAPGSSGEDNWSQRLDRPIGLYKDDPNFCGPIREFSRLIAETKRKPLAAAPSHAGRG